MLLPVFRDLIKPQWRKVLEHLKLVGGLPVSDLAGKTGGSYMAVKTHCEELTKAGYLVRTRLPRTAVGRPEIFYSLSTKADALFPQAGADFTLGLLEELATMFGESAPEKLLFQHFQNQQDTWRKILEKFDSPAQKAIKLASLRAKQGCANHCENNSGETTRIVEYHNPLHSVFERYPRAVVMEQRMIEQLLGTRVTRHEVPTGRESPARIVFELA
jgi:predicted ArsR family transcriptional regulator